MGHHTRPLLTSYQELSISSHLYLSTHQPINQSTHPSIIHPPSHSFIHLCPPSPSQRLGETLESQ